MSCDQLSLGYDAPTSGAHRKRDRQSAVDAARSMGDYLTGQQTLVLRRLSWQHDANAYELAGALGLQQSVVARRLTDLHKMGLAERNGVKRPGSSGRLGDCWRCTRRGLDWLAGVVDVRTDLV